MCSRYIPEEPTGHTDRLPVGHGDEEGPSQDEAEGADNSQQALWASLRGSWVMPGNPGLRGGPRRV